MEDEKTEFIAIDENGNEITCEILFTFESNENGKNYIAYTDNTVDEEGNTNVFASTYDPLDDAQKLQPIETEEEWKIIEEILEEIQSENYNDEEE